MSHIRHDPEKPALEVSGLTVYLGSVKALEDVSFTLNKGDSVAVVGPNGAGKSTLFKAIAGVIPHQAGTISVYGSEPGAHICIAYVPQAASVDWSFPVSVFDVVMMGRTVKIGLLRRAGRKDRAIVRRSLDLVNMADMADRQIGALSGGQRQRAFLARALAQEAEIVLLDEPLTGLDITSRNDIYGILRSLGLRGVTVLVATHDLDAAADRFSRIMLLNRKLVWFGGKAETITPELLLSTFGGHVRVHEGAGGKMTVYDTGCEGCDGEAQDRQWGSDS
jgi:ABC-type Mn2+/Zn2+ transport system ATPase subunit